MGAEYIVESAVCVCKFGTLPAILKAPNNIGIFMNGKLTATNQTLGNIFQPPAFGMCNVIPSSPKPCVPMISKWDRAFKGLGINSASYPLTDSSVGTCSLGLKGCVTFKTTGQISTPSLIINEDDKVKIPLLCTKCEKCFIEQEQFIENVKSNFKGIKESYIEEMKFILLKYKEYFSSKEDKCSKQQLAYFLATIKKETVVYKPIKEYFYAKTEEIRERYLERKYDPVLASTLTRRTVAKGYGNLEKGDGVKYAGRGYIQLTWRVNYETFSKKLNLDLVGNPDLALQKDNAIKIALVGYHEGCFTGVSIEKYINEKQVDYYNARRVINGVNCAGEIATDALLFEKCLS